MDDTDKKTKNQRSYLLQVKVFIGLGIFLLGSCSIFIYLSIVSEVNRSNLELLSQVKQLEVQGEFIQRRGNTYALYAPRDYPSYNRDVIIFYPDFMLDLEAFDNQVSRIAKVARSLPTVPFQQNDNSITESIKELDNKWNSFRVGFKEKIGPNEREPRLEWGADYVKENHSLIDAITGILITTVDSAIKQRIQLNKDLINLVVIGASILLLLGFIWFYFSVIRRITNIATACERVALGDFGYQLPTQQKDELGTLARAFNTLSSRTRLVVTMLTNMTQLSSIDNKVDSLWNEAGSYLPMQWLGLLELDKRSNTLNLTSMRTERNLSVTLKTTLLKSVAQDRHMLKVCMSGQVIKIDDITEVTMHSSDTKLLQQLQKIGLFKSALCVPLTANNNWKGMIVLVDHEIASYTDEHIELMSNLAPFIADGFTNTEKFLIDKNIYPDHDMESDPVFSRRSLDNNVVVLDP